MDNVIETTGRSLTIFKIKRKRRGSEGPNYVDVHVGGRLRTRRMVLGLTQQDVAKALDLTFQQVQKYERGKNRISASKLYQIAAVLQTPITYFFEEVQAVADPAIPLPGPTTRKLIETSRQLERLTTRDFLIARRLIHELAKTTEQTAA